ncbi:MAG: CRISPR-associated endoribonuclease Cas6, partial [Bacteroidota bacterium]
MQFRITLRLKQPGQLLPLSYQYELSAWIYHLLEQANSDFAKFLHEEGYLAGKKRFKLFVFSNLHIPHGGYTILDDRMKIHAREISFVISFLVPQAAQDLLMG